MCTTHLIQCLLGHSWYLTTSKGMGDEGGRELKWIQ